MNYKCTQIIIELIHTIMMTGKSGIYRADWYLETQTGVNTAVFCLFV